LAGGEANPEPPVASRAKAKSRRGAAPFHQDNPHRGLEFSRAQSYVEAMKNDVVPVQIRGLWPNQSGCALFVGNDEKVFIINVDPWMGKVINDFIHQHTPERPLTHQLILSLFKGFGIHLERVVITELKHQTFFARLILQQQNEIARKLVEVDARPSDCLALAVAEKCPIYVTQTLFDQMEDMSEHLQRINEQSDEME